MKIKNFFSLLMILYSINCYSQSVPNPLMADKTLLSPKAAEMQKFGDYPVSLYTGLIDISVPVYTINVNDITIPIEFKYHASGIKYNDKPIEMGLGWTLMAGGMINTTIRGSSDVGGGDVSHFIKPVDQINRTADGNRENDHRNLMSILKGNELLPGVSVDYGLPNDYTYDGEHDVYNFTIPGLSGKAIVVGGSTFYTIPQLPIDFTMWSLPYIIDEKGIKYEFGLPTHNLDNNLTRDWYLTKIISADKADTVQFKYAKYSSLSEDQEYIRYIDYTFSLRNEYRLCELFGGSLWYNVFKEHTGQEKGDIKIQNVDHRLLDSITYRGGMVTFEYNMNKKDPFYKTLKNIKIFSTVKSTPLRTIEIENGKFSNNMPRLDRVIFKGETGSILFHDYKFAYNDISYSANCTYAQCPGIDFWGYFNGKSKPLPPYHTYLGNGIMNDTTYFHTDRGANEAALKAGMLTKVTYPTKGYSVFTYEAHKAKVNGANRDFGGLRIKQVDNYAPSNQFLESKIYKYGSDGTGEIAGKYPVVADFESKSAVTNRIIYDESDPIYSCYIVSGPIYRYTTYSVFPKNNNFMHGSTVVYPLVTEYTESSDGRNGKTEYSFSYVPSDYSASNKTSVLSETTTHPLRNFEWRNGKLLRKTVSDNQNKIIYQLTNTYDSINYKEFLNLSLRRYVAMNKLEVTESNDLFPKENHNLEWIYNHYDASPNSMYRYVFEGYALYDYYNYYHTTGTEILKKSEETLDGVTKTTEYLNHNADGKPREIKITTSDWNSISHRYTYGSDLGASFQIAPFRTAVIGQSDWKGTVRLDSMKTNYPTPTQGGQGAYLYAPSSVEYLYKGETNPQIRIEYKNYDKYGNPVYMVKDGTTHVVYVWGYNGQFPIAKITNATYSDLTGKITESELKTISARPEPTTAELTKVNNLRTQLPNAMVTIYTYMPLSGIVTETDPRGVKTEYEYDLRGRLKFIKDYNGDVLESFKYKYKN